MFDSHAHVSGEQYENDRQDVIARARAIGVFGWMEVGVDVPTSRRAIELAEKEDGVGASVGMHPHDVDLLDDPDVWDDIEYLASHPAVKAIGEVGFDFFHAKYTLTEQKDALIPFLELAIKKDLPLIFHVRDGREINAHNNLISLLASYSDADRPRGVIHTYSGTQEQAVQYLELGMYLSFSGVVTFHNAGEIAQVAANTPLNRILLETDSPFLAPHPYRGKRNELSYVALVAEKVAALQGKPLKEVIEQTDENARKLFRLR